MKVRSLQELLLWKPPARTPLVDGGVLFPENKLVIFGGPKLGKSLLTQQLGFCLVGGQSWLGLNCAQCRVLYIQLEISDWLFWERVTTMSNGCRVNPNEYHFSTSFGLHLDTKPGIQALYLALDRVKPQVLILDPLYKLLSRPDESAILVLADNLDSLMEHFSLAVILVHHSRKPRLGLSGIIDMGGYELRGPIIEQWADSIIRLRGDLDTDKRQIEFELRHARTPIAPISIRLNRPRLWFEVV